MTDHGFLPQSTTDFPDIDPRDAPALSLLGHDLRAAVSEVMAGLRLVDTHSLDAANREKIARTHAAGEALSLLLEQALALMLGASDAEGPPQGLLQTERLLDMIRLRWQGRAGDSGLAFRLEAEDLPRQLRLDRALLERILSNLLGNAIKFAHRGCVTCRIGLVADRLTIAVLDDGPGFSETALPRLFQINSRPKLASKPGSGLGLHIVRDMVNRAGGSITARNRPEGGAEVRVDLPLPGQSDRPTKSDARDFSPDLTRCRLLLTDDSATSSLMLQTMLVEMGAEVVVASDGVEAIGRLERESFDLMVIDIEMPRMSGLDVMRHLRNMPGPLAQLPVLAITAHSSAAMRRTIQAAGATVSLAKPVTNPAVLGAAVAAALGLGAQSFAALPDLDAARFDQLLSQAGPATAVELVDRLLDDLHGAARNLAAAQTGPDWASIWAQSHILIALAGTVGGHRLQHLAEVLNGMAHTDTPNPAPLPAVWLQTHAELQKLTAFVAGKADLLRGGDVVNQ